jgi:hypothetical protein
LKVTLRFKREGDPDSLVIDDQIEVDEVNNLAEAEVWAKNITAWFNRTLRKCERTRILLSVTVEEETANTKAHHKWYKSNLITLEGRGGIYDLMKCEDCGITGKRHTTSIARDSKYKAKIYDRCDTAKIQITKVQERRRRKELEI